MSTPVQTAVESVTRMTEGEALQWRQLLRERSETTLRERAGRLAARQQTAQRRAHGLVDRQAARLARGRHAGPFPPDLDCTE